MLTENTKVMWLPSNTTSIHQPLDQGIIQNWKSNVKKQFIMFMAQTFDLGRDFSKEMNVLRAIRWGISAWEMMLLLQQFKTVGHAHSVSNSANFLFPHLTFGQNHKSLSIQYSKGYTE